MIAAFLCGLMFGGLGYRAWRIDALRRDLMKELEGMEGESVQDLAEFYAWLEDDNDQRFWQHTDNTAEPPGQINYGPPTGTIEHGTLTSASFGPINHVGS